MPSMSATRIVGFEITSTKIIRVLGRIAAFIEATSVGSARLVSIPRRGRSWVIRRRVRP